MYTWWKGLVIPSINALGRAKEKKIFSDPPILLGGCGRSGTSLLLSILSAHPDIFCFPHEVDAFTEWVEKGNPSRKIPRRIDRLYRYLLVHGVPEQNRRWCEKRPANVRYVQQIMGYYNGKAKFIHIIRDARDVLTSRHPENPTEYWITPERWVNDVTAGLAFQNHPNVLTIRYEQLIGEYEIVSNQICEFLDIAYGKEIINWYDYATVRSNRAWFGEMKKMHANSIAKWHNPEHRARIEEIMALEEVVTLMKELEYI